MSRPGALLAGGLALAAALGGGYWLGRTSPPPAAPPAPAAPAAERPILYYQNPDGSADYSPVPKKDAAGRDFTPVYGEAEPPPKPAAQGRILYYRNPMGLPDTSPVPKKDSMGMDYVPVREGEEDGPGLSLSLDKVQKLGVRTEAARLTSLSRSIRAVGSVQVDERSLRIVAPKVEGYIERLAVNQTGQTVARGQTLMEVYSPDLVLAQQEYQLALGAAARLGTASPEARDAAGSLAEGALSRLRNWDVPAAQIDRLRQGGPVSRTVPFVSPVSGIVLEKRAVQGMRFMPGDSLFQIADLSSVWVIAEVFEQDLAQVALGQTARVTVNALPGQTFTGRVSFVYPTVTPETRTAKVRIVLPNPGGRLKPSQYGTVELDSPVAARPVLSVPDSAVLDTGARPVVLVERAEGRFEPREVTVGARADGLIEIRQGLAEGERVVIRANFLIDAESNLRAALQGFQGK